MRRLLCSLVLFVAVGALVAAAPTPAPTQPQDDKKDEKKEDKKDDGKDKAGVIEVYQAKDGWRFRVLSPEGKSIAIGLQGYAKKDDCLAAVELLKAVVAKAKVTEVAK